MKVRAVELSPELQKYVKQAVDVELKKRRDEDTMILMKIFMYYMLCEHDWRGKRLKRLFDGITEYIDELVFKYEDCWEGKVDSELRDRAKIRFDDPKWRLSLNRGKNESIKAGEEERSKIFEQITGVPMAGPYNLLGGVKR